MAVSMNATIRDIDIGPGRPAGEAALTDQVIGAVVGGNIIAFGQGLSQQHQKDVLQSLLLAQLGANAKVDRQMDPANWTKQYLSILEHISWVVSTAYTAGRYLPQVSRYDAATLILDTFRKRLPEAAPDIAAAINAYKADTGVAQVVFECPAHAGGLANYQAIFATENDDGDVVMQIASASFNAPQHMVRLFDDDLPNGTKAQVGWTVFTLNESIFAGLRASLEKKLDGYYATSVAPLQATS